MNAVARSGAVGDITGGAVFLAGNALYFAASFNVPISAIADPIGPRFFPQAVAVTGMLLASLLMAQGAFKLRRGTVAVNEVDEADKGRYGSAFAFLIYGCLFVGLLEPAGYLLTTVLVLFLVFKHQGVPTGLAALVAAAGSLSMYALFALALGVRLPVGTVITWALARLGG